MSMALMEKTRIIFAIRDLMKEKAWPVLFTSDGPWRATLRAGTLIEEDLFDRKLRFQSSHNLVKWKNFDEYGKRWPDVCMELDGWFTRWKEPGIQRDQRSWLKLSMRSWSLAPLISICFMAGTNFGSWMVAQLGGPLICHRWRPMTMGGLCSMSRQSDEKYYASKKWWRPIIRNTHSKNRSSKRFTRTESCNWRPRLVLLGIW